jgi:hypothetical protein
MQEQIVLAVIGCLISGALGLNAWFVNRLVKKVDEASKISEKVSLQQNMLMEKHTVLSERVRELSDLSHRVHLIEKQHAVIEYVLRGQGHASKLDV